MSKIKKRYLVFVLLAVFIYILLPSKDETTQKDRLTFDQQYFSAKCKKEERDSHFSYKEREYRALYTLNNSGLKKCYFTNAKKSDINELFRKVLISENIDQAKDFLDQGITPNVKILIKEKYIASAYAAGKRTETNVNVPVSRPRDRVGQPGDVSGRQSEISSTLSQVERKYFSFPQRLEDSSAHITLYARSKGITGNISPVYEEKTSFVTPLTIAINLENINLIKLLLERGANIKHTDWYKKDNKILKNRNVYTFLMKHIQSRSKIELSIIEDNIDTFKNHFDKSKINDDDLEKIIEKASIHKSSTIFNFLYKNKYISKPEHVILGYQTLDKGIIGNLIQSPHLFNVNLSQVDLISFFSDISPNIKREEVLLGDFLIEYSIINRRYDLAKLIDGKLNQWKSIHYVFASEQEAEKNKDATITNDILIEKSSRHQTPAMLTAKYNSVDNLEYILNNFSVNLLEQDLNNNTILDIAIDCGHRHILTKLLNHIEKTKTIPSTEYLSKLRKQIKRIERLSLLYNNENKQVYIWKLNLQAMKHILEERLTIKYKLYGSEQN